VDEYLIRNNAGSLRRKTFDRDLGVCGRCDLDTDQMERILYRLRNGVTIHRYANSPSYYAGAPVRPALRTHWRARFDRLKDRLLRPGSGGWDRDHIMGSKSLWEADHIRPVVEGGGGMEGSLDNIRTLCVPCHKAATAELAAKRAERRQRRKERAARADRPQFGLDWKTRCDGCGQMRPAAEMVRLKGSPLLYCAGCDAEEVSA